MRFTAQGWLQRFFTDAIVDLGTWSVMRLTALSWSQRLFTDVIVDFGTDTVIGFTALGWPQRNFTDANVDLGTDTVFRRGRRLLHRTELVTGYFTDSVANANLGVVVVVARNGVGH